MYVCKFPHLSQLDYKLLESNFADLPSNGRKKKEERKNELANEPVWKRI